MNEMFELTDQGFNALKEVCPCLEEVDSMVDCIERFDLQVRQENGVHVLVVYGPGKVVWCRMALEIEHLKILRCPNHRDCSVKPVFQSIGKICPQQVSVSSYRSCGECIQALNVYASCYKRCLKKQHPKRPPLKVIEGHLEAES